MTTIAVLGGTGQQGSGLAQRFALAGARVIVGSRDPDRARATVQGWTATNATVEVADYAAAARAADVIVLAVPFFAVDALLDDIGRQISGTSLVIDITVPIAFTAGKMAMVEVPEGSAAEHIRARLPPGVRLTVAFKTIPAHLLGAVDAPLDCDEFVCGDSDEARAQTSALVSLLPGLRPVDVGVLSRARFIEHMTALAVSINRRHKIHDARFRVVGLT